MFLKVLGRFQHTNAQAPRHGAGADKNHVFQSQNGLKVSVAPKRLFSSAGAALALVLCLLLSACGGLSTRHLPKKPWLGASPQRIEMRYVAFNYETSFEEGLFHVTGEAFPDVNRLPDWASWYGDIQIAVYLVDSEGRVIDSSEQILPARALHREAGLPLDVTLEPGTASQQPLHITFGYRLFLLDKKPEESTRRTLVAEGALED